MSEDERDDVVADAVGGVVGDDVVVQKKPAPPVSPFKPFRTGDPGTYDPLEDASKKAVEGMKREWVTNFEGVVEKARTSLKRLDPRGKLSDILDVTTLGDSPEMVALLHDAESDPEITSEGIIEVLNQALEGPFQVLLVPGGPSPTLARAALDAIMADPDHPYHKSKFGDSVHRMATRLFQIAHDEEEE